MPTRTLPPEMHNEAVACFLDQDYQGPKELIIYNNDADLFLTFDHPQVKIINTARKGRTLGQLTMDAIAHCRYPLLAVWDDDDIRLPWHLSGLAKQLGDKDFIRFRPIYILNYNKIVSWAYGSTGHGGCVFRKDKFYEYGGYDVSRSVDCDTHLIAMFESRGNSVLWDCSPIETTFLYRWATGSTHVSGFRVQDNVMDLVENQHKMQKEKEGSISGIYEIQPRLRENYVQMVENFIKGM
jgi:hypothetical protein